MDRIFISLYKYFSAHKSVMYTLLCLSSLVFVFFALKVKYEEDISKLVPSAGTENSGLAFGNLRVKDKIFIQIAPNGEDETDCWTLGSYVDEFVENLSQRDSANGYMANVLYNLDADMAVNAIDYVLEHIPSFVDTSCYRLFDKAIEHADESMAQNYDLLMNDETGSATQMVTTDPLNLRGAVLENLVGEPVSEAGQIKDKVGASGFTIIDGHFFCADSTVALAFISPNFKSFDSGAGTALCKEIEEEAVAFEAQHPDVKVHVHGAPLRSVGNSRTIKKDLAKTIGLSMVVILIFICLCFKGLNVLWQTVAPVAYGAFFSLACIWWIKGGMSLMALGLGAIVLGVAISYCLHVIVHHHFVGDIEQLLKDESTPVCLGCITTIGAFLGLLFTKSELLKDFGLFATFALIGNTFFALTFLPHFLSKKKKQGNDKAFERIRKINSYPIDRKVPVLVAVAVIIVAGTSFAPKVGFDSDLRHLGYESKELLSAENLYADKNLHGNQQRYYAAAAETLDEALSSNKKIAVTIDSLKGVGLVSQYSPAISILFNSTEEQEERIGKWAEYWNDGKVAEAGKAISDAAKKQGLDPEIFQPFLSMVKADYYPESLYDAEIIPEELSSNFIEEYEGKYLIFNAVQLDAKNVQSVDEVVAPLDHAVVVDPFYYTNDMVRIIHDDFSVVLLISSIFVFLVLLFSFRNLLISIIAFLPMFFSWYVVQGVMAVFGLQFNLINIVISTFIFGIGVDYSIFVMQGLLAKSRGESDSLLEYHKVAIFFSAFVLLVVVLSLLLATHPAISSIGLSTLIGMCSTILITYTLQPFLYRSLCKWKARS